MPRANGKPKKPDGFKSQDQSGGNKTIEAGHVTEKKPKGGGDTKKEPNYSRKRH